MTKKPSAAQRMKAEHTTYKNALQNNFNILYMSGDSFDTDKSWSSDTASDIAEVVLAVFDGRLTLDAPPRRNKLVTGGPFLTYDANGKQCR